MPSNVQVNYLSRDYNTIRADLVEYLRAFFPEQWQDFNVASPGMAMLELNAYVADLLSHIADKKFIELYLDGAQSRESIYRLAKTKGYKVPGVRPALSLADIIIEVPATTDGPNADYLPIYRRGMQDKGAGAIFETISDIDFSSDFSEQGIANRTIEPILNANQEVLKYRIVKREEIRAGVTKILKVEVTTDGGVPFYQVELPEKNVLEIISAINITNLNVNYTPTYSQFNDDTIRYYEVDFLPTSQIFKTDSSYAQSEGIYVGTWQDVPKRFEKEFKADGSCVLTFGGGDENYNAYSDYITQLSGEDWCANNTNINLSEILDNTALGNKIPVNSTIFIQYRVGGGQLSNVGANNLNEVGNVTPVINGPNSDLNAQVVSSTRANNPIPAIGGKNLPSVNEIRSHIAANHAAQERCVTLPDYISRAYQLGGKYGGPFRIHGEVEDNKVKFHILTRDGNGKLISSSTNRIKDNLVTYITKYRMINDFVEINDGKVINLETNIDLFIDSNNFNAREIVSTALEEVMSFFDVENWEMNQHIYVSQLTDILREVPGVINVVNIEFCNLEGGGYSEAVLSQAVGLRENIFETGGFRNKIELIDNPIFSTPLSMI